MHYDRVIKNGRVVDGLGIPAYYADIGIKGDCIAAIGRIDGRAGEEIDAGGLFVAPGFVDIHTHMDAQLLWDPMATPSSFHGITSIVISNCGFAIAPAKEESHEWVLKMMSRVEGIPLPALVNGVKFEWTTYPEYLQALERRPLGVNVAAMAPHSTIRYYAMGEAARERKATSDEIERMKQLMREALRAGCFGFSSTWNPSHADADGIPVPSRFASEQELLELVSVLREFNTGFFPFAPKGLFAGLEKSDFEFMGDLSRACGRPVVYTLLQLVSKPDNWKKELEWAEDEVERGARIFIHNIVFSVDAYFSFATAGSLFDDMPHWSKVLILPLAERIKALADPAVRARLASDIMAGRAKFSPRWEDIYVGEAARERNKHYEGRCIVEIAAERGISPLDALFDLALDEDLETEFIRRGYLNNDAAAIEQIVSHPLSIPGVSDAGAHWERLCQYGWPTHFLSYWVRYRKTMALEEAIRRLSFIPAHIVGLRDRGFISEGAAADLVIFDYEKLKLGDPKWTQDGPGGVKRIVHYAEGIRYVIVNGEVTIRDGEPTGALPGKLVRSR